MSDELVVPHQHCLRLRIASAVFVEIASLSYRPKMAHLVMTLDGPHYPPGLTNNVPVDLWNSLPNLCFPWLNTVLGVVFHDAAFSRGRPFAFVRSTAILRQI